MRAVVPEAGRKREAIGRLGLALGMLALAVLAAAPARAAPDGAEIQAPQATGSAIVTGDAPVAVGCRIERTGATTRLVFDLSSKLSANAYLLEAPDRVIVDLPQVNFQIDPAAGRPKPEAGALIRSFRFGLFAPGRSRIVIDLASPATLVSVSTVSVAGGDPSRLVIELTRSDRAAFHKAASAADVTTGRIQPVAAAAAADPPKPQSLPVIVIDPGHGGVDPGASGIDGVVEKSVVFDFASALADKLKASGRYAVVMTRTGDSFVSLGERVRIARDANAALFVSIHADTLAVNGTVTGATVYTASDKASDAEAARVAEHENQADSVAGVESTPAPPGVNDILFDLTRRETRTYAHLFQRTLVGYWQKIARLNKNPERAAGFKVLQAPDVPSVLLELGYLSSDRDVRAMTSPEWRSTATTSIVRAIDSFFAPRQPANATPAKASLAAAPSGAPSAARDDMARASPN